jgi:uncharacterized membrane protein YccF (DUF307 family)
MTLLLNILWFIFGGWIAGLAWLLAGVILSITIIGLPWAPAAFRIAGFSFFPFGKQVVSRDLVTGQEDLGTGPTGLFLNVLWVVFAGWWLCLGHITIGVAQCLTLIGIPFGWQHFKLAVLALAPVGKTVVEV